MRAAKKMMAIWLIALMVLFSATSALAEGSMPGGFVAPSEDKVYLSLYESGRNSLYSVPGTGGDLSFIESGAIIGDLLVVNNNLYYITYNNAIYQIMRRDYLGTSSVLSEFTGLQESETVEKLSYYRDMLYCLVGGVLTLVDPSTGESLPLWDSTVAERMEDYVIADRVIYYISAIDQVTYQKTVPNNGTVLEATAGRPYSMSLDGTNAERLAEFGVKNIQAQGDHIYFENLEDSYITGADPDFWIEGKLYRFNMQTRQPSSMNLQYTWDYHTTPNGVVVYTKNDISLYPLTGGTPTSLMQPEDYTVLFAVGTDLYVYEQTKNILTKVPVNGLQSVQLVGGAQVSGELGLEIETDGANAGTDGEDIWEDDSETTGTTTTSTSATVAPTKKPSSGTDGSYIFKDSNKKKLTRARIKEIDSKLWSYARNEIYARHGYKFNTKKYRDYFNKKSWYSPGGFSTGDLNEIEWYNMDLLKEMEDELSSGSSSGGSSGGSSGATDSSQIFPNSSKKKLTVEEVKSIKKSLRPYARNEIYARNGYEFNTKKFADYFKKKTWYKPGGFSTSKISEIEWYNMELIKKYE